MTFLKQGTNQDHRLVKELVESNLHTGETTIYPREVEFIQDTREARKTDKRHKLAKIVQILAYWPVYALLKFFFRLEIKGQNNLIGLDGQSVIFASNHASYIDGLICAASMPRWKGEFYPKMFFPLRFLVWYRYLSIKFLFIAIYIWINGSIKIVPRGGDLKKCLSETIMLLERGEKIWIYPEGKISPDGKLHQGKRGVSYLHKVTNIPVVPVGITGNFGILSFKTLLRKNKVIVNIGRPINSLDDSGNGSLEEGVGKVMTSIKDLIIEDA